MDTIRNNRPVDAEAEIPRQFICQITKRLMLDPVTGPDGFSYERDAWESHERAALRALRSPITRALLPRNRAVPNNNLRSLIAEHPATQEELRELILERAAETPLPRSLWDVLATRVKGEVVGALAVAGGTVHDAWEVVRTQPGRAMALPFTTAGGAFLGAAAGIGLGGFVGTWVLPNASPSSFLSVSLHAPSSETVEMLAFVGARVGMLYGLWYGARVGLGYDTPLLALERSGWHALALGMGVIGAWFGMLGGFTVRPVVCFTTSACDVFGGDPETRVLISTLAAFLGGAVCLGFGIDNAAQWERQQANGRRA